MKEAIRQTNQQTKLLQELYTHKQSNTPVRYALNAELNMGIILSLVKRRYIDASAKADRLGNIQVWLTPTGEELCRDLHPMWVRPV